MQPQLRSPVGPKRPDFHIFGTSELFAIWVISAVMAFAVFITYTRLPLSELYRVSLNGLAGGASRSLTYLNYPVAFIVIALIGFSFARLYAGAANRSFNFKVGVGVVTAVAFALLAYAAFPGVIDDADLDARLVNVFPAIGVLIAIALTILSATVVAGGVSKGWGNGDRIRLVISALAVFLSLPWLLANFGVYVGDIPVLGSIFMSRQIPAGETLSAVHLGDHHGFSGVLFLLSGLWLSRLLVHVVPAILRWLLAVYVSLMMVYGFANAAQDFWLEQVVKRGWATVELPSVTNPAISQAWGLIILATALLAAILILQTRRELAQIDPGQQASLTEETGQAGDRSHTISVR
jgi:hypothetical protein